MQAPNVLVGWSICPCERGGPPPHGHNTWTCNTCAQQWREGGCKVKGLWHQAWPPRGRQR